MYNYTCRNIIIFSLYYVIQHIVEAKWLYDRLQTSKLGLKLKRGSGLGFGLCLVIYLVTNNWSNCCPMIKYECIFMFIYVVHLHITSACDLLQHTSTRSLLFLDSFNSHNVIIYKQIHI